MTDAIMKEGREEAPKTLSLPDDVTPSPSAEAEGEEGFFDRAADGEAFDEPAPEEGAGEEGASADRPEGEDGEGASLGCEADEGGAEAPARGGGEAAVREDEEELRRSFPFLGEIKLVSLPNALRYGRLRDLGLSPEEALLASHPDFFLRKNTGSERPSPPTPFSRRRSDGRSELSYETRRMARDLFPGLDERELEALYRRTLASPRP